MLLGTAAIGGVGTASCGSSSSSAAAHSGVPHWSYAGDEGPDHSKIGEQKSVDGLVGISAMVPADLRAVRYQGSLTTPPCTEGVRWTVLQAPIAMSSDQLRLLEGLHGPNARPVQSLNGRALEAGLLTR